MGNTDVDWCWFWIVLGDDNNSVCADERRRMMGLITYNLVEDNNRLKTMKDDYRENKEKNEEGIQELIDGDGLIDEDGRVLSSVMKLIHYYNSIIEAAEDYHTALEEEYEEVGFNLSLKEEEIEKLQTEISHNEDEMEGLENRIEELENEIEELNAEIESMK